MSRIAWVDDADATGPLAEVFAQARAARAVFFNLEQRIVLSGGADLTQGANTLKGETVTIFMRENRSVVTGGEGGRVRAVIQPKGLMDSKEKEKEKAAP